MSNIIQIIEECTDALPTICRHPGCLESAKQGINHCPKHHKPKSRSPLPKKTWKRWKHSAVYIIGPKGAEIVKIGVSENLLRRIKDLSLSNPFPLWLYGVFIGKGALEKSLHEEFQPYRKHGEWFECSGGLSIFMRRVQKTVSAMSIENAVALEQEAPPCILNEDCVLGLTGVSARHIGP